MLADNFGLTDGTLMNLGQQWAQKDLRAAREGVLAKPACCEKDELLERDANAVAAWVQLFPEGDIRIRAMNEPDGIKQYQSALSSKSRAE